jgi:chromosome segregation ATPase
MTHGLTAPQRARYSDHSLAAYLAPLVEGRRVAVVGPASGEVARRFRALGAATVVAFGGSGDGIAVRALTPGAIAAFHGKLDCVVVPDATAVQLDTVLDEARRALGHAGIVAVAARTGEAQVQLEGPAGPAGAGYYALHDALASRFDQVQMLGRGPFVGYTIAVLGDGGEGVTLDTRLMPDEPPAAEAFIAVASDSVLSLEGVALVQVPAAEVLAGAAQAEAEGRARVATLEAELQQRETKLKEVETASAERWVRVQRLEHELKTLDEDARKARDRGVRLSKELEDERKLRQRIELDAQMSRRAPELPRGADPEELRQARERATELEQALTAARAELTTQSTRVAGLERELDETQATEVELRAQLDAAERAAQRGRGRREAAEAAEAALVQARAEAEGLRGEISALRADGGRVQTEAAQQRAEGARLRAELTAAQTALTAAQAALAERADETEFTRLERELKARAGEVLALQAQIAERDAAVRELAYSLEAATRTDAATQLQAQQERIAELASLNGALASEATEIVGQNELLRERIAHLETELKSRADLAQQAEFRVGELEAQVRALQAAAPSAGGAEAERALAEAQRELEELRSRQDEASDSLRALERRAGEAETQAQEAARSLAEEYARGAELQQQLAEARTDLQRQYALVASVEDRAAQTALELEGARAGYRRRVRELEREVEQLVQSLAVATTQSGEDGEGIARLQRDLEVLHAERTGLALRLRDAEAALQARSAAPAAPRETAAPEAGELRAEQLLGDLAETAARLASTEEAMAEAQENALRAQTRAAELEQTVVALQAAAARTPAPSGPSAEALEALQRESAERELLSRSLVAQLEDRDLRLRAMERRLVEEVERARRIESEIWEVELRARDQRIAALSREVERGRGAGEGEAVAAGPEAGELTALRTALEGRERELQALRGALEQVRAGLSSILVDGRGAVVAHDLVSLLRQLEASHAG